MSRMGCFSYSILRTGLILIFLISVFHLSGWAIPNRTARFLQEKFSTDELKLVDLPDIQEDRLRNKAYRLLWSDIVNTEKLSERRKMVEVFSHGVNDEASSSFVAPRLASQIIDADSFSDEAKQTLLKSGMLGRSPTLVRAVGISGAPLDSEELKMIWAESETEVEAHRLDSPTGLSRSNLGSMAWAALLVRAKAGDEEAISDFFEIIGKESPDELIYEFELIDDMAYVRHSKAVDMLVGFVLENDGSPYAKIEDDYMVSSLGFRAAKALSFALEEFPVSPSKPKVYPDDMEVIKEYLRNYEGPWRIRGKWKTEEASRETESITLASTEIEDGAPANDPKIDPSSQTIHEESHAEPSEKKSPSNPWLWLLGALILLGGLGLVLARKKSSSNSDS